MHYLTTYKPIVPSLRDEGSSFFVCPTRVLNQNVAVTSN